MWIKYITGDGVGEGAQYHMEYELGSHKDLYLNPLLFSCCVILGKLFSFPDLAFLVCKMNPSCLKTQRVRVKCESPASCPRPHQPRGMKWIFFKNSVLVC